MSTTQPLPVRAANPAPPRDREAHRLLHLWANLAQRAAAAAAHAIANDDETALRNLQLQVEDALVDRIPEGADLLDELVAWEATLIHVAETPPETCLICRKARLGLPPDLPLPASIGGAR